MFYLIVTISVLYISLTILLLIGWKRSVSSSLNKLSESHPAISVIVAVRNEASTISTLLRCLSVQQYPTFEVLLVDDGSDDQTASVIEEHISSFSNIRYLRLTEDEGKKKALECGIRHASGEIIITTDADCRMGPEWLASMASCFASEEVHFAFGPVRLDQVNFLTNLQAIEFSSLVAAGAATHWYGFSTMCNGANIAFRRSSFYEVGGYSGNESIASGDDEFLLRKMSDTYPQGTMFIPDKEAIVTALPQSSLLQFIHQRVRWAGKWRLHKSFTDKAIAMLIFLMNFSILFLIVGFIGGIFTLPIVSGIMGAKMLIDFLYLKSATAHTNVKWNGVSFITLFFCYPLYACYIGVVCNFGNYQWKKRGYKNFRREHVTLQGNVRPVAEK